MVARYRLNAKTFINDTLLEAGAEIDYAGEPNTAMDPINAEAEAAVKERQARIDAKADALKAGVGATADPALVELVNGFVARLEAQEKATAKNTADIAELDAGVQIVSGRVDDVESVITAASTKRTTPTKPKAETPVAETPTTDTPPTDPAVDPNAPPA